ncbi:hypothetical protein ONZ45_g4714 [Pleurotus djamor]|nr:hypothetical protein ONZ45_g4714 [Pleurotus djamor]
MEDGGSRAFKASELLWSSLVQFSADPWQLVCAVRKGQLNVSGWAFGVREGGVGSWQSIGFEERIKDENSSDVGTRPLRNYIVTGWRLLRLILSWPIPHNQLTFTQLLVILSYLGIVLFCLAKDTQFAANAHRAGFLAMAQMPIIFLFATKNNFLALLLGPGSSYEKLNFAHRWVARTMFFCSFVHSALWVGHHILRRTALIGPQKETTGVLAFAALCAILVSSTRRFRECWYRWFALTHTLGVVCFFIAIFCHTPQTSMWLLPPLALYAMDTLHRLVRYRVKEATLSAVDGQMTLIRISKCHTGWTAGQHLRARVFLPGIFTEVHPFTIISAPSSLSSIPHDGILLGAKVCGNWTRRLNEYARLEAGRFPSLLSSSDGHVEVPVKVMIDGPYGGSSVDLGSYEVALLVAGGSGATFTLALLDDIVGRCVARRRANGEITKRIEFVWFIKSFGSIHWFAPVLSAITTNAVETSLDLRIRIFVTCLCEPTSVPSILNCDIILERPSIHTLVRDFATPLISSARTPCVSERTHLLESGLRSGHSPLPASQFENGAFTGGGVAICASGPQDLVQDAEDAAARLGLSNGFQLGGVALHTESFTM